MPTEGDAMNQHTPGPWKLSGPHIREQFCKHANCLGHPPQITGYELRGADDTWIASIHGEHCKVPAEACHANARLIAQAPAMWAALRAIIASGDGCRGHGDCHHGMEPWYAARAVLKAIEL